MKLFTVIDTKTGKEADPKEIALTEKWAMDLWYCDMEGFFIGADGTLILADECGNFEYVHWAEPDQNYEDYNNRYEVEFSTEIIDKLYSDICECETTNTCFYIDGQEFYTDTGYALDGIKMFIELLKQRLLKQEKPLNV